jgi:uncharacterized protein (DUF1697 family)
LKRAVRARDRAVAVVAHDLRNPLATIIQTSGKLGVMTEFVALLRGINVGGNNLIKMSELKRCFEKQGFGNVRTFIASGNVLFEHAEPAGPKLVKRIEGVLEKTFDYRASVVLRSEKQLREIVTRAPKGFGTEPKKYRYDVLFLKEPLTAGGAMKSVSTKEGVDRAFAGKGVIYFSRLIAKATQSRLPKLVMLPVYKNLTIRNWNTTTKILALMGSSAARR